MRRTGLPGSAVVGTVMSAFLLAATGCTAQEDAPAPAAIAQSSPPAVAMRVDRPAMLLGTWPESVDRGLHDRAEQNMSNVKKLLSSEPTSLVGTAYVRAEEVHSRERGLHIPGDDQRVIMISAVSGTITDPTATVDKIFGGIPNVTDVRPVPPGPLGGTTGCGIGQAKTGLRVDICVWSDHHTLGMVTFVGFAQADDPHGVFGQIRAEVENPAK